MPPVLLLQKPCQAEEDTCDTHDVLNPTVLCLDGVQSAPQLLQNDDDEHVEELLRNEELENAISAGAVTVRR